MFKALDGIFFAVSRSIWYIAKPPKNLKLLLWPMVCEGLNTGKTGWLNYGPFIDPHPVL